MEQWLPVVGWEGLYEVSDLGRVRSIERVVVDVLGRSRRWPSVLLTPFKDDKGYLRVRLWRAGRGAPSVPLHRLVAATFIGLRPDEQVVRHKNGNSEDNSLSNLWYGSVADNNRDLLDHGSWSNGRDRWESCKRGHELRDENLVPSSLPSRECLSCSRARSQVSNARKAGRPIPDVRVLADRYFAELAPAS